MFLVQEEHETTDNFLKILQELLDIGRFVPRQIIRHN